MSVSFWTEKFVLNVVREMAFDSRTLDRALPGQNVVGSRYFDDAEKLHSDLIDLSIGVKDLEVNEEGIFKSLTESIASGKYSITAERKVSNKEVFIIMSHILNCQKP